MYLLLIASSALVFVLWAGSKGCYPALWVIWPVTMLLSPAWTRAQFGGLRLDFRGVVAATAVLVLAFGRAREGRGRVVILDVFIVLTALAHATSIVSNDMIRPSLLTTIAFTYMPYAVGRRYLATAADLPRATAPMAAACLVLSALSAFESITRVNPLCLLTGMRFPEYARMGLIRAYGSVEHPITLGNILVLGLPWVLVAARRARDDGGPAWLRRGPLVYFAGLIGALSRGPILAAVGTRMADAFFRRPPLRVPLLLLVVVGGVAAFLAREGVVSALSEVAGENRTDPDDERIVVINGKEHLYSGTVHRILQFEVYTVAMANAGLFGFGAAEGLPGVDEELGTRFWSIDNQYITLLVKRGYVGFALFNALTLGALVNFGRASLAGGPGSELAGVYFGAILCVALNLLTVWLDPSLSVVYLFAAGLSANLGTLAAAPGGDPEIEPLDDFPPSKSEQTP